jgi:LysM repeat protein
MGTTTRRLLGLIVATLLIATLPVGAALADPGATATRVHVVMWGDSLTVIATRYGVTQQAIIAANDLPPDGRIAAGQALVIPHAVLAEGALEPPAAPAPQSTVHVVQRGETLFRISLRYGVSMDRIVAANNILNPAKIFAGQQLIIPTDNEPAAPAASEGAPIQHVVQPGEILGRIANRYGVSMASILQANHISNPSLLYAGQVINIPVPDAAASDESAPEEAPAEETEQAAEEPEAEAAPEPAEPAAEEPEEAPAEPASIETATYTIQPGDTLQKIALRYNSSVVELMALNQIVNMDRIFWGQTIIVPQRDGSAPPPAAEPAPAPAPAASSAVGKEVLVDLSEQRAYAYENGTLLKSFVVSTGLPGTPTVTGTFAIYVKYRSAGMTGPGYNLPNVPYVMYFYRGYGLHGTYWHNNFGHPMSHGCVNFRTPDAEWIYNWAPVGTTVRVQW